MSEETPIYGGLGLPTTKEAFLNRPCALLHSDPDYVPPTPEEVGALISYAGWSQKEVAQITGVVHNAKGSSTVRRWKAPVDKSESRQIPYAVWRLMLIYSQVIEKTDDDGYFIPGKE